MTAADRLRARLAAGGIVSAPGAPDALGSVQLRLVTA